MFILKRFIFLFLVMLISLSLFALRAEVLVVTHPSNQLESISKNDVKAIFMGEKLHWKDGTRIKIADNLDKKAARQFFSAFLNTAPEKVKTIWIKKMLKGQMSPPESFRDNDELLNFIAAKKGAIGFTSHLENTKGLKVLKVVDQ